MSKGLRSLSGTNLETSFEEEVEDQDDKSDLETETELLGSEGLTGAGELGDAGLHDTTMEGGSFTQSASSSSGTYSQLSTSLPPVTNPPPFSQSHDMMMMAQMIAIAMTQHGPQARATAPPLSSPGGKFGKGREQLPPDSATQTHLDLSRTRYVEWLRHVEDEWKDAEKTKEKIDEDFNLQTVTCKPRPPPGRRRPAGLQTRAAQGTSESFWPAVSYEGPPSPVWDYSADEGGDPDSLSEGPTHFCEDEYTESWQGGGLEEQVLSRAGDSSSLLVWPQLGLGEDEKDPQPFLDALDDEAMRLEPLVCWILKFRGG
jgi:hypothetical protein